MASARLALLALPLTACTYAKFFRDTIPLTRDRSNLHVVGAFSPDGRQFVAAEAKLTSARPETAVLRVWERGPTPDLPDAWRLAAKVRLADLFVVDLAFSPDSRVLAVAGLGRRHNILLFDAARGRARGLPGNAPMTQSIAFGPRGDWLVSAGIDGRIRIWDVKQGSQRATVDEDAMLLKQSRFPLAVGRDGSWIAYGRTDGRVGFADPATGQRIDARPSGGREIYDLAASPDGRWLAVASDDGVSLWDLSSFGRRRVQRLSGKRASAVAFYHDSRKLLACGQSPGRSKVYELPSGRVAYGFLTASANVGNAPLDRFVPPALGPREEDVWRRLHRTFPLGGEIEALRAVVLGYVRAPGVHRVAVSPEDLWVVFFDGGNARLVITLSHYEMRMRRGSEPPRQRPTRPPPVGETI